MTAPGTDITRALQDVADGRAPAASDLLQLVYDQLRRAAQAQLASERAGHTLSATALVHEAYLKLAGPREIPWTSRGHFYAAAAEREDEFLSSPTNPGAGGQADAGATLETPVPVGETPTLVDRPESSDAAAKLTEKTLFTEHRTIIGTPEYMNPEQAEGSLDIDTRTEV